MEINGEAIVFRVVVVLCTNSLQKLVALIRPPPPTHPNFKPLLIMEECNTHEKMSKYWIAIGKI